MFPFVFLPHLHFLCNKQLDSQKIKIIKNKFYLTDPYIVGNTPLTWTQARQAIGHLNYLIYVLSKLLSIYYIIKSKINLLRFEMSLSVLNCYKLFIKLEMQKNIRTDTFFKFVKLLKILQKV